LIHLKTRAKYNYYCRKTGTSTIFQNKYCFHFQSILQNNSIYCLLFTMNKSIRYNFDLARTIKKNTFSSFLRTQIKHYYKEKEGIHLSFPPEGGWGGLLKLSIAFSATLTGSSGWVR
jgi:hypothetical protein